MAGATGPARRWRRLSAGAYGAALAAGPDPTAQAQARAAYLFNNGPMAIATLAQSGSDLATIVRDQIVARGANYVVVNNVYDMAGTPAASWEDPTMRSLIGAMVEAFNRSLRVGVQTEARIGLVDVYALTRDEQSNPAFYGLNFNTTWTACGFNGLDGNALFCNVYNTWPGVDVSHYMYADSLQWTPYAQWLLARQVAFGMQWKGWL
jgi:outer membrane lipase/esterase